MLSLEQRLEFDPDAWEPEPGDTVTGEVVEVVEYDDGFNEGETYPVVSLATSTSPLVGVKVFGSKSVLKRELRRRNPAPGDRLGIKYLGPKGKPPHQYEAFRIVHDRARPADEWVPPTEPLPESE